MSWRQIFSPSQKRPPLKLKWRESEALSAGEAKFWMIAAAVSAFGQIYNAYSLWTRPAWINLHSGRSWYDAIPPFLFLVVVVVACHTYLQGIQRETPQSPPRKKPWRSQKEWRVVVIAFGCVLVAHLPLEILTAFRRYEPPQRGLWAVFPVMPIVTAVIGLVILRYDRRRVVEDDRKFNGWCLRCGYDLRETPDQCPECGSIPRMTA